MCRNKGRKVSNIGHGWTQLSELEAVPLFARACEAEFQRASREVEILAARRV